LQPLAAAREDYLKRMALPSVSDPKIFFSGSGSGSTFQIISDPGPIHSWIRVKIELFKEHKRKQNLQIIWKCLTLDCCTVLTLFLCDKMAIYTIFYINTLLYKVKNSDIKQKSNSGSFPDRDTKFQLRIRILQIVPDPTGSGSDTLALPQCRSIRRPSWPCV